LEQTNETQKTVAGKPALAIWVRSTLLAIALGWTTVFGIAAWLKPYDENGQPLRMATHARPLTEGGLGLPPCTFKVITGLPCPSCGMTTSFALLMHGDVWNSLKANAVGTLLAMFGLVFVPWSLASVLCKRTLFISSMELPLIWIICVFLALMLIRWVTVLVLAWVNGSP
jgi:hypothetical protein